jgi:sigma-B regulation protein RsbU (phosphoserine phosphatase)
MFSYAWRSWRGAAGVAVLAATALAIGIGSATAIYSVVNAGHTAALHVRRTDEGVEIRELSTGGTVLGLFPDVDYEQSDVVLCPGDVIVAFTDGIPEALNRDGEEFGDDRLKALARDSAAAQADEIAARLAARMRDWIAGTEQYDDLAFIVATIN